WPTRMEREGGQKRDLRCWPKRWTEYTKLGSVSTRPSCIGSRGSLRFNGFKFQVQENQKAKACPETCMMDVELCTESSCTMVAEKAIEPRRHCDGEPDLYSSGLRCVCRTGCGQAEHLGELSGPSRSA